MAGVLIARGDPLPQTKSRPLSGVASSRPLLPQRSSSLATQAVSQSPIPTHQRIDTDIKGVDIDPCTFRPRHYCDLEPWHIWYRHRCLSTRQRNHQANKLHFGRTILVGTGIMVGVDIVPAVTAGPIEGPKGAGISHVLASFLIQRFAAVIELG